MITRKPLPEITCTVEELVKKYELDITSDQIRHDFWRVTMQNAEVYNFNLGWCPITFVADHNITDEAIYANFCEIMNAQTVRFHKNRHVCFTAKNNLA